MYEHWDILMTCIKVEGGCIHKIYDSREKWCALSDRYGKRYMITPKKTLAEVQSIIHQIKKNNGRITANREADAEI